MDSVVDDVRDTCVQTERSCHQPFDVWKRFRCRSYEVRNVFAPVPAWRQEVGEHDDARGSAFGAFAERGGNVRLGQLHVSGFDDGVVGLVGEILCRLQQHVVAGFSARTVIDDNHGGCLVVVVCCHRGSDPVEICWVADGARQTACMTQPRKTCLVRSQSRISVQPIWTSVLHEPTSEPDIDETLATTARGAIQLLYSE